MKVLNISYDDYANFAHENANALRSVGVDCLDVKRVKHVFGYNTESKLVSDNEIFALIDKYDIIQLFHSYDKFLNYAFERDKKIFVYHTGTTYRQNSEHYNKVFNDKVEIAFTDQCEFIGLGMKNETYIATAINTDLLKPINLDKREHLFGHYPSNPTVKGTDKIMQMCADVKGIYDLLNVSTTLVSSSEQYKRMAKCACYIELFNLNQLGKQYGCYGVTAFEASALGCMVITNNVRQDVYKKFYGDCALIIANSEVEFKEAVKRVAGMSDLELKEACNKVRKWLVNKHSYKATGNYLKKYLF